MYMPTMLMHWIPLELYIVKHAWDRVVLGWVTSQEVLVFYMPMEFCKLRPIYPTCIMGIILLSLSHI
jgi:hypothetical protein